MPNSDDAARRLNLLRRIVEAGAEGKVLGDGRWCNYCEGLLDHVPELHEPGCVWLEIEREVKEASVMGAMQEHVAAHRNQEPDPSAIRRFAAALAEDMVYATDPAQALAAAAAMMPDSAYPYALDTVRPEKRVAFRVGDHEVKPGDVIRYRAVMLPHALGPDAPLCDACGRAATSAAQDVIVGQVAGVKTRYGCDEHPLIG